MLQKHQVLCSGQVIVSSLTKYGLKKSVLASHSGRNHYVMLYGILLVRTL